MGWHILGSRAWELGYAGDGCDVKCVIASVVWLCGGVMASELGCHL